MKFSTLLAGLSLAVLFLAAITSVFAPPGLVSAAVLAALVGLAVALAILAAIVLRRSPFARVNLAWLRFPRLCLGLALTAAMGLAGCSTIGGLFGAGALTPAQSVFALEGVLTAAVQTASVYAQLPSCGAGVTGLCSDPATVKRIDVAAPAAQTALLSAEAIVAPTSTASAAAKAQALASAQTAVGALTALTSTVQVPPKPAS